jgi:4-amino-4-deoxy-L-arabinose transferase-like glycosyltransferase
MNERSALFSTILWLAAASIVAMLFYRLGAHRLMETSDARYTEIAWEMVDSGDWITPRMNTAIHLDKPPIAYWFGAAGLALLGHSEWAVRLPLAIAATLTLLLVLDLGRWLFGGRAGLLAVLVLGTAPLFVFMARLFTTDLYLTLWVVAAYYCFLRGYAAPEPRRRWAVAFAVALSLGFLTKGPVVFLHTFGAILPYHFLWGRRGRLRPFFSPVALATFVLVTAPWFVVVAIEHPGLWNFYFRHELVARVSGNALNRRQPFYYFAEILLVGLLPWAIWLPALARKQGPRLDRVAMAVPDVDRLLLCWALVPFVVLSIVRSKLPPYILPLLPALALWTGALLDVRLRQPARPSRLKLIVFAVLAATVAVAGVVHYLREGDQWYPATLLPVGLCFAVTVASLIAAALSFRGRSRAATFVALLVFALFLNLTAIHYLPNTKDRYRYHNLALQLADRLAPDDVVVNYRQYLRGLPFYLRRPVTIADCSQLPHPLDASPDLDGRDLQSPEALQALLASDRRVWVVVQAKNVDDLRQVAGVPLYDVGQESRYRLLCNRQPEGSATDPAQSPSAAGGSPAEP